jgi:hypothetical protein
VKQLLSLLPEVSPTRVYQTLERALCLESPLKILENTRAAEMIRSVICRTCVR